MQKSIYKNDYQKFLQLLREARLAAGLSQEEVAKRLRQTQSPAPANDHTDIVDCARNEQRQDAQPNPRRKTEDHVKATWISGLCELIANLGYRWNRYHDLHVPEVIAPPTPQFFTLNAVSTSPWSSLFQVINEVLVDQNSFHRKLTEFDGKTSNDKSFWEEPSNALALLFDFSSIVGLVGPIYNPICKEILEGDRFKLTS